MLIILMFFYSKISLILYLLHTFFHSLRDNLNSFVMYPYQFDLFISLCSSQQFCSVGDDSCLILWDARIGNDPVVKVGIWINLF